MATKNCTVPDKQTKLKFKKGFWWGKLEHKLETYTTALLFAGLLLQAFYFLTDAGFYVIASTILFVLAAIFRVFAGIAHKVEKHYMDTLRFGRWKKK